MSDNDFKPDQTLERPARGDTPVDAGSQALAEALRSSFGIVKFVMVLLVCVFLGSGFFTVGPQERAIIIRLGKPMGEGEKALLGPGLHWSLPYPIDEYRKIPITAIQRVSSTIGWYAVNATEEAAGAPDIPLPTTSPLNPLLDGYLLTADNNIIHARADLTYHINRPVEFIFNFVNASNAVQNALDNALLYAASQFKVDDILTRDVAGFKEAVKKRVIALVEQQQLGVEIEECSPRTRAPRQLTEAFNSVTSAEQKRGNLINAALTYANQVTNRAQADAQSRIDTAQYQSVALVNDVTSQAERFRDLLPNYRANPNLFRQQRLAETMGRVLTNMQDKIFFTEGDDGKPKELRLLLNRDAPKQKEETK